MSDDCRKALEELWAAARDVHNDSRIARTLATRLGKAIADAEAVLATAPAMIAQTCLCPDPHCAIHGVPVKTTLTVSTTAPAEQPNVAALIREFQAFVTAMETVCMESNDISVAGAIIRGGAFRRARDAIERAGGVGNDGKAAA